MPESVEYESVDAAYLEQRSLHRTAGPILLWGLGVGYVISGDYFGWNFGLNAGGFGGLLLVTAIMAALYLALIFSIAELASAVPVAGGPYAFARRAPTFRERAENAGGLPGFVVDEVEEYLRCGILDLPPGFVAIMEGCGLQWLGRANDAEGGSFGCDPMHFQVPNMP